MTGDFKDTGSSKLPQDMASRMQAIIRKHAEGYRNDLPMLIGQMRKLVGEFSANQNTELLPSLQREAHDMKGQAATFGMPGISAVANSLSRMLDVSPQPSPGLTEALEAHIAALEKILENDDPALVASTVAKAKPFI